MGRPSQNDESYSDGIRGLGQSNRNRNQGIPLQIRSLTY